MADVIEDDTRPWRDRDPGGVIRCMVRHPSLRLRPYARLLNGMRPPPAIALTAALFVVTGYEAYREKLYIRRPFWTTTIDRQGLRVIRYAPYAFIRYMESLFSL